MLYYTSLKSKSVTLSVLSVELFAVVNAFEVTSTLLIALNDIFERVLLQILYTESNYFYELFVGTSSTTEKLLLISLSVLHQSYELKELTEVL